MFELTPKYHYQIYVFVIFACELGREKTTCDFLESKEVILRDT